MRLTKRDKKIIEDLNKFRCMDRDSIAELHFQGLKNPSYAANNVLLRLLRDGHIQRSTAFVPYVYFGPDVNMKKNSAKIGHFLAILNTYKEITRDGKAKTFLVEPKYGEKGTVEPDIYCSIENKEKKIGHFFIEVQRSIYSEKQMKEKLNRYENLFNSGIRDNLWKDTQGKEVFPYVLIISDQRYAIDVSYPFSIFQAPSYSLFLESLKPRKENIESPKRPQIKSQNGSIKFNIS